VEPRGRFGAGIALARSHAMVAFAQPRLAPVAPHLVLDAAASPHVRLRVWKADAGEPRPRRAVAHAELELSWLSEGALAYGIGSQQFDLDGAGAIVVPSGVEHSTTFPSFVRASALWIDRNVVVEIADALGKAHGPTIGLVRDAAPIASLGAVLAEEAARGARGDRGALLATDAITEAMIAIALRGAPLLREDQRAPRDPSIASAVRYIEASYADALTVEGMARAAKMSRFHFSRRFRDETGRSPYRYLMDVRLERAAELLRRGRCGVTEVALTVGFSDPSRFARMFRARFGASPARWSSEARARVLHVLPA
jgi:AraC family transcriptional regulator